MNFYQSISDYYDYIFPQNTAQISFVLDTFQDTENMTLLDIGCGTGNLDIELSKHFQKVLATDLDKTMIEKATNKLENTVDNLQFIQLNMLNIETEFDKHIFDGIICFGNTLVHLDNASEMFHFFKQSNIVLKPGGKLLLQIINYDRIIDKNIVGLPTIENDHVKFVRDYHYEAKSNKILFKTLLTIKKDGREIENILSLYPIRKEDLNKLLKNAGFTTINFYGNFKREPLHENSIPLVVECY
jgi:glycine/sarcosine N-methyltransferase